MSAPFSISTAKAALPVRMLASPHFLDWMRSHPVSLALTTYQSARLMLLGVNDQGQLSGFERVFEPAVCMPRQTGSGSALSIKSGS